MIRIRTTALICVLLLLPALSRAERRFVIGNQYDFTFGGTNQSGPASGQVQSGLSSYFGFYPNLDVKSFGRNSTLHVAYTAFAERFEANKINALSHAVDSDFQIKVGPKLKLGLLGYYFTAPSFNAVTVLRGVAPSTDSFQFAFQPATATSNMRVIRGEFNAEYDFNYRSYLMFRFQGMSLNYSTNDPASGLLFDQTREEGRAGYWYRLNPHQDLGFEFIYVRNDYSGFGSGTTQASVLGYSRQFSPALQLHLEAGPAHVLFQNVPRFYGYYVAASAVRTIKKSQVTLYYRHTPGDSSGQDALSDIHSANLAIFSPLWKELEIRSSFSGFYGRGVALNRNQYKGFNGVLDLSIPLSRRWFLAWGGSYQLNLYNAPLSQEYKRVYIALRFNAPQWWRPSL